MPPAVSVVLSTRDRPLHVKAAVASILACPSRDFELLVVDQSRTDESRRVLAAHEVDPRFRYLPSDERGLSRARNAGIAATSGPIVAFTDDDCRVDADWLEALERVFLDVPDAALVFGTVRAPAAVNGRGYLATFEPAAATVPDWRPRRGRDWGIGANMALRRRLTERVGLFDPILGAGAPFPAAEDMDLAVRARAQGLRVTHAAAPGVEHVNVLSGREASRHWRGYGIGIGAAFAKHARLRTGAGGAALLREEVAYKAGLTLHRTLRGQKPTGLGFLVGLLKGAAGSLRVDIDRERGVFRESPARID